MSLVRNQEAVYALNDAGAFPGARDKYGHTALHLAADKGHIGVIVVLVDIGADPNAHSKNGATPADVADAAGRSDVIAVLRAIGADR